MSDSEMKKEEAAAPAEAPLDTIGDDARETAGGGAPLGEDSGETPEAAIARLEAEKADLTDRLLRTAAEMDNLRRRTERDVADARRYAVSKFAGDVLVIGDNLQRTLDALPAEARDQKEGGLPALIEGVEMTARELDRVLDRHGVKRIEAEGTRFDPNLHQAMFEVPDDSVPAGTVVKVVQAGYTIGDRTLRAAMVGVSKGGPAASENGRAEGGEAA